ncbi:MAG: DUF2281 domain-containing protein [Ignavibacteriales bacterium]
MKPGEVEKILNRIMNLPPEAQKEVADFISLLYERYQSSSQPQIQKKLAQEDFIGLWKDRPDMQDSTSWVRDIRKKEWLR